MNIFNNKKFRYGSISVALVAVIIAAVILVNAIFTALANKLLWFIDMTPNQIFTLSDEAIALLDTMENRNEVVITFCTDADVLESNQTQRIPYRTALQMSDKFDNIKVRYVDVYTNPSAVSAAQQSTSLEINSQSIIVSSGTEYRVFSLESMYTSDSSGNVIGYRGEQTFVSAVLAVTKTDQPIACFTKNHGELDNPNVQYIKQVMEDAGCLVVDIDLLREEIPEGCRFVVVVDPQNDFSAKDDPLVSDDSDEIRKLEAFLSDQKSMMVFFDNATPYQQNFETFLSEWGIGIARDPANENSALIVRDSAQSFDPEGLTNVASYVKDKVGIGASITKPLWNTSNPKSVLFPYAAAMYNTFPSKQNDNGFWQADAYKNGRQRVVVDVFTSSNTANAEVGGAKLSDKQLTDLGLNLNADTPFSYMKLAYEMQNNDVYSYVLACSSTDFGYATQNSGYGNHTVLSYATSMLGRDAVAVTLDTKYFNDTEISNVTSAEANIYTIVLTVVPSVAILAVGTVIMIRRRFS